MYSLRDCIISNETLSSVMDDEPHREFLMGVAYCAFYLTPPSPLNRGRIVGIL